MATTVRIKRNSYTSMEAITRQSRVDEILQRALSARPPVDDSGEADLRWGKKSRFELVDPQQVHGLRVRYATNGDGQQTQEPPPECNVLQFDEVQRGIEEIRIENPEDSQQYVIVERIAFIIFSAPDGMYWRFNLKHDE